MKLRDLHLIQAAALKNLTSIAPGRLDGMTRDVADRELVTIAYYKAVLDYLTQLGAIQNDKNKYDVILLSSDSEPQEDDYLL